MSVTNRQYGGRWRVEDPTEKDKLNKSLGNISGIDKTSFSFYLQPAISPAYRIVNTFYDGEFRDKVVYQKISLSDYDLLEDEQGNLVVKQSKANVELSYGRLYSILADHNCYIDVELVFIEHNDEVKLNMTLTSDGICFPKKVTVDLNFPDAGQISRNRVVNYVVVLNTILMIYCFVINKQCNEAEQNQTTATRISMWTLSWNTIWNFCLFNIHLSYALQLQDYGYFAIPA